MIRRHTFRDDVWRVFEGRRDRSAPRPTLMWRPIQTAYEAPGTSLFIRRINRTARQCRRWL